MLDTAHFASLDVATLADQCHHETKKYFRGVAYEARYCFELLCRACRDHYEAALIHIYAIYLPILAARARRHPLFPRSSQDADSFAHIALSNFYHAVKGEKFMQKFGTLNQAIAYMHACIHTVILNDAKDEPPADLSELEPIPAPPAEADIRELWTHIASLLADDQDRRLTYLRFVLEMKPAEIAARYPQFWATPRDVSIALQRIRRCLHADPTLRERAGLTDDSQKHEI
jgi:hypothetical protein